MESFSGGKGEVACRVPIWSLPMLKTCRTRCYRQICSRIPANRFRIRALAIEAKERDLSFFATADGAALPASGCLRRPDPVPLVTQVVKPKYRCRVSRCSVPSGPSLGRLPHYVCHLCDSWRRAARTASASWSADSLWLVERLANHQSPRRLLLHTERRPDAGGQVSKSRTVLVTVAN